MKKFSLSIPKRMGIALLTVLLTLVVALGISTNASAKSGKQVISGCTYNVNDNDSRTTVTSTGSGCLYVIAYIEYRSAAGALYIDNGPEALGKSQTGQVLSPCTITSNYARMTQVFPFTSTVNFYTLYAL